MSSTLRFSSNFQPIQASVRFIITSTVLAGPTGTTSLVQLESQILTLRSTIITVTPQAENHHRSVGTAHGSNDSPRSGNAPSDQTTATMVTVAAQDFSNLQQEYNKLMFKKHKVWSRSSLISKAFIGVSFQIHNGSKFILLKVTSKMVGYRFGEFVPSRKVTIHKEAKKKK